MNTITLRAKVSSACEPLLFRQLREQRGWTQATLAAKSGYSLRLISKMEAGKSVSPQSHQDVADALSLPERPVSVDDLTSNPVGLARQYIAAMYEQRENRFAANEQKQLYFNCLSISECAQPSTSYSKYMCVPQEITDHLMSFSTQNSSSV